MIDSKLNSNQEEEIEERANWGVIGQGIGSLMDTVYVLSMVYINAYLPFHGSAPVYKKY